MWFNHEQELVVILRVKQVCVLSDGLKSLCQTGEVSLLGDLVVGVTHYGNQHVEQHNLNDKGEEHKQDAWRWSIQGVL